MSAHIIDPKTMDVVVWAANHVRHPENNLSKDNLGQKLYRLNFRAIEERYGPQSSKDGAPGPIDQSRLHHNYRYQQPKYDSLVDAYTCLDSLIYQCSEGRCFESDTYKYLEQLRLLVADKIICDLPNQRPVYEITK